MYTEWLNLHSFILPPTRKDCVTMVTHKLIPGLTLVTHHLPPFRCYVFPVLIPLPLPRPTQGS